MQSSQTFRDQADRPVMVNATRSNYVEHQIAALLDDWETVVLRASESRRRLYGVDAPTKVTASFAAQMTEEEALAILADYPNPFPG
tara:strand:- start:170 stop:427 length:258 start_codon:yes stop_codon:yes gene_type:complete